jgi:general secretion pathway protein A
MYTSAFGLTSKPFDMTPDPAFLFLTMQHREALAGLGYALSQKKGCIVLTGEAGTGKTTLLRRTFQMLAKDRIQSSLVLNPTLTANEFLESVLLDFGIGEVPASKAQRLVKLQNFLLAGYAAGKVSALVIDEAHKLSIELLEEVRLLGNFERSDCKLLQIVLAGQPELDSTLNRPDLWQLKQRVALHLSVRPLSAAEVAQYIQFRWTKAGGAHAPFPAGTVAAVLHFSRGIPRVVNSICDNALELAFGEGSSTVTQAHILEVAKDLRLNAPSDVKPSLPQGTGLAPLSAGSAVRIAQAPTPPVDTQPMKTLERYNPSTKRPWLSRWFTHKVEIA